MEARCERTCLARFALRSTEIISRIHLSERVAPRGAANEFCALLSPADYPSKSSSTTERPTAPRPCKGCARVWAFNCRRLGGADDLEEVERPLGDVHVVHRSQMSNVIPPSDADIAKFACGRAVQKCPVQLSGEVDVAEPTAALGDERGEEIRARGMVSNVLSHRRSNGAGQNFGV